MRRFCSPFHSLLLFAVGALGLPAQPPAARPKFEGHISVLAAESGQTVSLRYTIGPNALRIEIEGDAAPNPVNLVDRNSGLVTLLLPSNRSFVRWQPGVRAVEPSASPGLPPMASPRPPGPGSGAPAPAFTPMMRPPPELKATGQKEVILGFSCAEYHLVAQGERLEIWATEELLAFHPFRRRPEANFGLRTLEEQSAERLHERGLFPLRVTLHAEDQTPRRRFEVQAVTRRKIEDPGGALFQPPGNYVEMSLPGPR